MKELPITAMVICILRTHCADEAGAAFELACEIDDGAPLVAWDDLERRVYYMVLARVGEERTVRGVTYEQAAADISYLPKTDNTLRAWRNDTQHLVDLCIAHVRRLEATALTSSQSVDAASGGG